MKPGDLIEYSRDVYSGDNEKRTDRHIGIVTETDNNIANGWGHRAVARILFIDAPWCGDNLIWVECEDLLVLNESR